MSRGKPDPRRSARSIDQRAIDASQFASDADQMAADSDQASAERDERAAASDQRASDLDQLRADESRTGSGQAAGGGYEASRASRAARTSGRRATQAARHRTARLRIDTAGQRVALAAARDEAARRRDVRAESTDELIVASDVPVAEKIERIRARSAAARARAAADRDLAARDRAADALERSDLLAERSGLEEQLRQTQKMEGIGRLAGGIAHDFNNLLTAIRGNASLALAALPPDHEAREDLEQIEQAADRAASLTRQLLAFARRTVLQPEVVDLAVVLRRIEPMLRRLVGDDVNLVIDAPAGTSSVLADPGQLEQIIVNLAVNARDAMPDGGTLTIAIADGGPAEGSPPDAAREPVPMTTLSVTDTGVGMDAKTLERAFEPFFTTKAPGRGTGLGLSTVYGIVRQSGGSVSARSEPGHGSTIAVHLPCAEYAPEDDLAAPEQPGASRARTGTILVVEDDGAVRRFATRALKAAGYTVLTAADGAAAIEAARGTRLDMLVTDMVMPGVSGLEVANGLGATQPGLPVLFMSGHPDQPVAGGDLGDTGSYFLAKPFSIEALLAAVDTAMDRTIEA